VDAPIKFSTGKDGTVVKALVIREPGSVILEDRPEPPARDGEVVVRPRLVGICGTDLDILEGTVDADYVRYPLVPGHEWSGEIVSVGAGSALRPGDRVVVEGIVPCGTCPACVAGDTNRCETYDEFGFVRDGAMTQRLVAPERLVHRLADWVSLESAALVEPAAVVLRALLLAPAAEGMRALVIGDGTVGLLAARLLRLWSPASVAVLGRRPAQAELARLAGADRFETDAAFFDHPFDLVVEAAGAAEAVRAAVALAARGGRVVLLGYPGSAVEVPLPIDDIVNGDLSIVGSFSYTSAAWRRVVELLGSGELDLGFLVTHRFALDDFAAAFDALRNADGPRGKVIVEVPSDAVAP
jgi:2-desacetyl-2-hydroxyethyl bacteriochlorophyllide A dehydrogenase